MTSDLESRKRELRSELVSRLKESLTALEQAYRLTKEAATHEEAKPENDKDTRALEQSYLARGQAQRVDEMRAAVVAAEATPVSGWPPGGRVALGALLVVEEDGETMT